MHVPTIKFQRYQQMYAIKGAVSFQSSSLLPQREPWIYQVLDFPSRFQGFSKHINIYTYIYSHAHLFTQMIKHTVHIALHHFF